MDEPEKPGLLDRMRARFPWFDHVMRAQERYSDCNGNFYAAGITYFTIFALFPLLMVGFAAGGFLLASRPDLMSEIEERIRDAVSGDLGQQLITLMDSAIDSRGTVGVIGLATAAWAGLGWMANLRAALTQMWEQHPTESNFVRSKLSDLVALISAFLAMVITIALTALGDPALMRKVLHWMGIQDIVASVGGLRVLSILVSVGISWMLFTWIISRLPREAVPFRSALRAGLLAAVGFEIFKQVASIYLQSVLNGPAGATFGPVLGLMVFAYVTARLILFATAWAATTRESLAAAPVPPPEPAQIVTRVQVHEGVGVSGALAAAAMGAVGALGLSRLLRR
ncbi:inner membrane protein YhjD [Mycolicibacterium sp. (ex Dasyatis americana)]|uniref:Inner membrane protein YhjD n=1 Tax=Mycobacterium syngnathidarum TaxID=1908205 RepID=A0A1S1K032_9MYCO|nr:MULTISPECIES: inner membrane protein YhjD [Mycobacterium]OFB38290.1 inner membrane protein YhjD [Mycolicibacterium sp. (ex Dasyatis americana)]MCG7606329.1 inner membrane protein YhjD [Mycobacterium sp. CnD-18-1]OHT93671.1 inner membrane protein YhjD [Mycobacterium syngnathidarum]OLT87775.1 inner membrane protein YhjD [Mycobacterium syngnathidarum]TMS52568.1 inner membrane protein YhjD [Mycobacterium sp. DBP42]